MSDGPVERLAKRFGEWVEAYPEDTIPPDVIARWWLNAIAEEMAQTADGEVASKSYAPQAKRHAARWLRTEAEGR